MTHTRRLDALTKRYPHRPAATSALDFSALTPQAKFEFYELLDKLNGVPTRPNGRPDLSPLSDAELERLNELAERIAVKETR